MADQIQELIAGQAPSLMQAEKGNELIRSINALKRSRGLNGIQVKVDKGGELVISQAYQHETVMVFMFANGYSWTARGVDVFPAVGVEFWSLQFYINDDTGTVDHEHGSDPDNPVTLEENNIYGAGGLFDGDADNDQTYTRVPIIASGRYVNTSGTFKEVTFCHNGVPVQQFIKIA